MPPSPILAVTEYGPRVVPGVNGIGHYLAAGRREDAPGAREPLREVPHSVFTIVLHVHYFHSKHLKTVFPSASTS